MKLTLIALLFGLVAARCHAQEPVERWADVASYATAAVNPTLTVFDAVRSDRVKCRLTRLAVSEAIGNGAVLTLKHFVVSPRPCVGCLADGFPSGHTANSAIGFSGRWQVGMFFALGTAELRTAAHRHTPTQVAAGALLGFAAEWAGTRLVRCE